MMRAAFAALLLLPAAANAAVYKCTVDGHMTFQDHPCAGNSELLLTPAAPTGTAQPPPTSTADWLQQADKDSKQRQIESLERQNRQLKTDQQRAVDAVQKEAAAPGYYGDDVSDRVDRVQRDFDAKTGANQSKIDALRKDIEPH